jgi:hypothetical protein
MADFLHSYVWHALLCINKSVLMCFRYIPNVNWLCLFVIVKSRYFSLLCVSFSIVNSIFGCIVLNSVKV